MKTIVLAGASSAIAKSLQKQLPSFSHQIVGISRSVSPDAEIPIHQVNSYHDAAYPEISDDIDGLVYFPGTIVLKPFKGLKSEEILHDFNIHVLGAMRFIQHYLPRLKEGASVVCISSVAASIGLPFHASVSISKAGLEGLIRALAAEYAGKIRFNAVAPSLTDTPLAAKFLASPEKVEAARQRNPMKKVGSPDDLASAIAFLLSENSSWMTGQVVAVDGGMSMLKV
ncbi:MAG: SDR family oxidoreductase [Cytophagaceae bacterium]|jgi:NAD(P)-dependent dehydrogenase (short-subunit alcohol dehydrogenase family)|nr:SDR family oxidoreductase [Cytophagaceae bacterium]